MVTFDGRSPGTPPSEWQKDARLTSRPDLDLDGVGRLIVLAAHPDDETLGAGGLIATAVSRGLATTVVVVTDGAASHPASSTHDAGALVALRDDEARRAVAVLGGGVAAEPGVGQESSAVPGAGASASAIATPGARASAPSMPLVPTLLGYPDGSVRENRAAITRDLRTVLDAGADAGVATRLQRGAVYGSGAPSPRGEGALTHHTPSTAAHDAQPDAVWDAELLPDRPRTTLLVAPWRGDGHRDHRVLGEIAAELAAAHSATHGDGPIVTLAEYPIWMWHWGDPAHPDVPWGSLVGLPLDADTLTTKRRALAEYVSQVRPLSPAAGDESVLHPTFQQHFDRPMEFFVTSTPESTLPDTGIPGPSHVAAAHFEARYAGRDDPWGATSRWYESRKRMLTMASLPEPRYGSAFEIGCSIGVLTEQLATRCDRVLAVDLSETAVALARTRLGESHGDVRIEVRDAATDYPDETFDLVVLSEVGYYLSPATLAELIARIDAGLSPGGTVLACHWRHPADDFLQSGDDVHAAIASRPDLHGLAHHVEDDFVLDVWSKDARSVAARTGLRRPLMPVPPGLR